MNTEALKNHSVISVYEYDGQTAVDMVLARDAHHAFTLVSMARLTCALVAAVCPDGEIVCAGQGLVDPDQWLLNHGEIRDMAPLLAIEGAAVTPHFDDLGDQEGFVYTLKGEICDGAESEKAAYVSALFGLGLEYPRAEDGSISPISPTC